MMRRSAAGSRLSSAVFLIFLINSLSLALCCIDYCVKTRAPPTFLINWPNWNETACCAACLRVCVWRRRHTIRDSGGLFWLADSPFYSSVCECVIYSVWSVSERASARTHTQPPGIPPASQPTNLFYLHFYSNSNHKRVQNKFTTRGDDD